jgi:ABC-2 type transport system permease protein
MILKIATTELKQQYRDGVLTTLAVMLTCLLGMTLVARYSSFVDGNRETREASQRVREQWVSQGKKHPHSGAHFGTYVFRHSFPTELLEPGAASFSGTTFPLVTHSRSFPADVPIDSHSTLTRYGELSPGVLGLALLSLFTILSGYGVVALERQNGTIQLLLASGASPGAILVGKIAGLGVAIGSLWLVKCLLEAAFVAAAQGASGRSIDVWLRFAGYQGVQLAYVLLWIAGTVTVSALIHRPRVALVVLLSFWIGNTILLPRVASTAIRLLIPEPSAEEFFGAIKHDIAFKPDGTEWVNTWSKQLIAETLQRYGVERIEDLPVGYAGVMLKGSDAHYEEVYGRHFERLHELHRRQEQWHHWLSFLGPWVAARSVMEGFAGSDIAHLSRFSNAAEQYRRRFVESTNDAAEHQGKGTGWELEVGRPFWESIPDFQYDPPSAGWAVRQHLEGLGVLAAWAVLALAGLAISVSRLERQS